MRLCHFEDAAVVGLEPLTLTRPAFDLLCGKDSLAAKQRRVFPSNDLGALVRPEIEGLLRTTAPALVVNDLPWLRAERTILVNARWIPPAPLRSVPAATCLGLVGDEVAYAVLNTEHLAGCAPNTLADCLQTWKSELPPLAAGGRLIRHLWELVEANGAQLCRDAELLPSAAGKPTLPSGLAIVGPAERLWIDPSARIEPMTLADTTRGPVLIGPDASIGAFSRLEGPCAVGRETQILGARIRAGTTLGPACRVGGEVEASIIQGYTNKYHDGFLGHSYVGEWVNLGAGTQNSDLRNDYTEVQVPLRGKPTRTGLTKAGCYLGDHTKTGLGTLLNTGTTVGAFCNLLPAAGFLPKWLPSFTTWWKGQLYELTDRSQLWDTAAEVMRRRGQKWTTAHQHYFENLYAHTDGERASALRGRGPQLRRSA